MQTPDLRTREFEEALEAMDVRLRAQDFESAILVGEELTRKLNADSTSKFPLIRVSCLKKTAEAMIGIRKFELAMQKAEEAQALADENSDVCAEANMSVLFVLERALNATAMLEKLGSAESELKSALVSQYLQQTGIASDQSADAIVDQELLDRLYNAALRNLEEKSLPDEQPAPGLGDHFQDLLENKTVQAVLGQSVLWLSIALCLVGVLKIGQYALTIKTGISKEGSLATLQKSYCRTSTAKVKENELLSFKSTDGIDTLSLNRNNVARYASPEAQFKGHFMFYDGSPTSAFATILWSNLSPTCLFQCRGASIVSQMGTVFFNRQDGGYKLVDEINHVAFNLDAYLKAKNSLPESDSPLLVYENPETKRPSKIIIETLLDTEKQYEPGSIVLVTGLKGPSEFRLYGCDHQSELLPVERTATKWQSLLETADPPKRSNGSEILFIFCERPFSSSVEFLRSNLWVTLFGMIVGGAGLVAAGRLTISRASSKLRTRKALTKNSAPPQIKKPK